MIAWVAALATPSLRLRRLKRLRGLTISSATRRQLLSEFLIVKLPTKRFSRR